MEVFSTMKSWRLQRASTSKSVQLHSGHPLSCCLFKSSSFFIYITTFLKKFITIYSQSKYIFEFQKIFIFKFIYQIKDWKRFENSFDSQMTFSSIHWLFHKHLRLNFRKFCALFQKTNAIFEWLDPKNL
jgi:hypothetical protein